MTHRKLKHHPIKTGKGLAHALNSQSTPDFIYPTTGITADQFDQWVANVLASRRDQYDILFGHFLFIRQTLWSDEPIKCSMCNTIMTKRKSDNNIDLRQCPNCLTWTTFENWYSMHVYRNFERERKMLYEK